MKEPRKLWSSGNTFALHIHFRSRKRQRLSRAGPINPSSRVTCCLRHCYVARGVIWNEKSSFDPFPSKEETERRSNFENLRAVCLWRHTLLYITN